MAHIFGMGFFGFTFWSGVFLEVLLGALRIFWGFARHLNSGVPPLGNLRCPLYRHV